MGRLGNLAAGGLALLLAGCGTRPPDVAEFWEGSDGTTNMEISIKQQVYCHVKKAVEAAGAITYVRNGKNVSILPDNWGAQITVSLTVDETGAVNPGISVLKPLQAAEQFTLGAGGTLSSQATRNDKYTFYYGVKDLKKGSTDTACTAKVVGSSMLLSSDLGIEDWLTNALQIENLYPSTTAKGKNDTLTYEIKFLVISSGNVNPSWKLVRFTSNTSGSSLLTANRTRTHDLTITFGPTAEAAGEPGKSGPSRALTDAHQASQIGLSITNNLQSVVPLQ